jgi:hypothetical protein
VAIGIWAGVSSGKQEKAEVRPEHPLLVNVVKKFEDALVYVGRDYVADTVLQTLSATSIGACAHADNIPFYSTLKYQINKGHTVYGGGGIIPDYFVLVKVCANISYFDQLQAKKILPQYVPQSMQIVTEKL